MTIKEVCGQYGITPDTIRYYERVGVIPAVNRTKGGIRDFSEEDVKWVKNAICMRNAGLPVEMLIEYVRLFQEGDSTFQARYDLLVRARAEIQKQIDEARESMKLIDYKISKYEEALKTGVLQWDAGKAFGNDPLPEGTLRDKCGCGHSCPPQGNAQQDKGGEHEVHGQECV